MNSRIEDSEDPALDAAKELLDRIDRRDFYQAVFSVNVSNYDGPEPVRGMTADQILEEVRSFVIMKESGVDSNAVEAMVLDECDNMNGNDHRNGLDIESEVHALTREDLTAFTKKITTGMTTSKVNVVRQAIDYPINSLTPPFLSLPDLCLPQGHVQQQCGHQGGLPRGRVREHQEGDGLHPGEEEEPREAGVGGRQEVDGVQGTGLEADRGAIEIPNTRI